MNSDPILLSPLVLRSAGLGPDPESPIAGGTCILLAESVTTCRKSTSATPYCLCWGSAQKAPGPNASRWMEDAPAVPASGKPVFWGGGGGEGELGRGREEWATEKVGLSSGFHCWILSCCLTWAAQHSRPIVGTGAIPQGLRLTPGQGEKIPLP